MDAMELLGRPLFGRRKGEVCEPVRGSRVLVTGAGGSIGREVVAQLLISEPAELILTDLSECNLYEVDMRVKATSKVPGRSLLMDVRDHVAVSKVFSEFAPEVVFHCAALKHVPLLEDEFNLIEAIRTNVFGTQHVLYEAKAVRTKHVVLLSTDKAVNPISRMGETKKLAERIARMMSKGQPVISVIRFGNVLGSSGSVVPLFEDQITHGGPVTVTDPWAARYFMSVREAVELMLHVLGHAADKKSSGLYMLDMGEPVKIMDLAKKMIQMRGLRPGVDIEICVIGLRPGDKLEEQLYDPDTEKVERLEERILQIVPTDPDPYAYWMARVDELQEAVRMRAMREIQACLLASIT